MRPSFADLIIWFPTPPEKLSFFSSPCKGDRFAPKLVQSSPLFKGSTCGAGVGLKAKRIKNFFDKRNATQLLFIFHCSLLIKQTKKSAPCGAPFLFIVCPIKNRPNRTVEFQGWRFGHCGYIRNAVWLGCCRQTQGRTRNRWGKELVTKRLVRR